MQPSDLETDLGVVIALRAFRSEGAPAVEMLRYLDRLGATTVEMMTVFRNAFGLSFDDVSPIGGWFADGSGELDDERLELLLGGALAEREALLRGEATHSDDPSPDESETGAS